MKSKGAECFACFGNMSHSRALFCLRGHVGHGTVIVRPDYETMAVCPMVASIFRLINPLTGRIRYQ